MHPIWLARLDETRPVLVLTREEVRAVRRFVTVAPITTTIRGLSSEVAVGARNGLESDSVVNLDSIITVPRDLLVRPVGALLADQEPDLTRAFVEALDLDLSWSPLSALMINRQPTSNVSTSNRSALRASTMRS